MNTYDIWDRSALKSELARVRTKTADPENQSVFFSGPGLLHGYRGLRNSKRAALYAAREGISTIQHTDRGSHLASHHHFLKKVAERTSGYDKDAVIDNEWNEASRSYAQLAHGHVKAYVAGASKKDVFRKTELGLLIANLRVHSLNGIPRAKLARIATGKEGLDRAYNMVVRAGFRQDMEQALRTGDRALIKDALEQRQLYENQLRLDRNEPIDRSNAAIQRRETEIDQKADRIATLRQMAIYKEALQETKAYLGNQAGNGASDRAKAEHILGRVKYAARNPQKADRIRKLIRLKRTRDDAIQSEPDAHAVHAYLTAKEQYERDLRAIRQFNGQQFAGSSPLARTLSRHRIHRALLGHAPLNQEKDHAQTGAEKPSLAAQRPNARAGMHEIRLVH